MTTNTAATNPTTATDTATDIGAAKQLQSPPEKLPEFYRLGKHMPYKALTTAEIRRMYWRWIGNDNDTRDWQQVWEQRVKDHIDWWQKKFKQQCGDNFKPEVLGEVTLSYENNSLIFNSKDHPTLKLSKAVAIDEKWVRQKIADYADEWVVAINTDELLESSVTVIKTRVEVW